MKREQLLPFICAFLLFGVCQGSYYISSTCSVDNFDLLPLQYDPRGPPPAGYSFYNATTSDTISINFCAQVSTKTGCSSLTSTNPTIPYPGACQSFPGDPSHPAVIGDATTAELSVLTRSFSVNGFTFSKGVVLTYTGGGFCQKYNSNRRTEIAVVCPPSGFNQSLTEQIYHTFEPGFCVYQVVFVSKFACATYAATSCSYENWDLLPLQYNPQAGYGPSGYSFTNSQYGDTISINFCAAVESGCENYATGSCRKVGGNYQSIGDASMAVFSPLLEPIEANGTNFTEGVILTYPGGAYCSSVNSNSTTKVIVVCPPANYTGVSDQIYTTYEYDCLYEVIFVSYFGCTTPYYAAPICYYGDWNLMPLQYDPSGPPPPGYSFRNSQNGDTIAINFCAQVSPSTGCNSTTSSNPQVTAPGSCQLLDQVPYVAGDATKTLISPLIGSITVGGLTFTQGVTLAYYYGTFCENFNAYRSTEILVLCPPPGYAGNTDQIFTTIEHNCFYQVAFVSQYGCL